jgi:predicted Zn-dependent protease
MGLKGFLFCIVVIIVGIFAYLRFSVNGNLDSYFNQHTRFQMGKYKAVRALFGLHNDGDARVEYLNAKLPIVIEVVKPTGTMLDERIIKQFADKVAEFTGKQTTIFNEDHIPSGTLNEKDLALMVSQHRRHAAGNANLFVIYADDFVADNPNEIGRTYLESSIVISDKRLKELTQGDSRIMPSYQLSTMLHEFGHQVGLGHNNGEDCIMNTTVEQPERMVHFFSDITPTSFCELELDQLKVIKASLQ